MPDLEPEEVGAIPEVATLPQGARILSVHSWGTYDGTGFDGLDPSAVHDCFFVCSQTFGEVAEWLEDRLAVLDWPPGRGVECPPAAPVRLPWRQWSRDGEDIDLIDFTTSTWTGFDKPPEGCSMLRLNYSRKPERAFASQEEARAWFEDGPGKGERWRQRLSG